MIRQAGQRFFRMIPLLLAAGALSWASPAQAGGYLAIDQNGAPYVWPSGVVHVRLDQGGFGDMNKQQADALTLGAMSQWTSAHTSTSAVVIQNDGDLIKDYGNGDNQPEPEITTHPGYCAVIYDQTGDDIALIAGEGNQNVAAGVAGPDIPENGAPGPVSGGIAIFNGLFLNGGQGNGGLSDQDMQGVITHEFGHVLDMDHAQANLSHFGYTDLLGQPLDIPDNYTGVPTMFPAYFVGDTSLEIDDMNWVSTMYPTAEFSARSSISGTIRDYSGLPLNGVNIVARSTVDPFLMITCVSGYDDPTPLDTQTGHYTIPGLPGGTGWVLDTESIASLFAGGSRVGQVDPPLVMPGPPEYINEPGIESNSDDAGRSTTFVIPSSPPANLANIDMTLNSLDSADQVQEVDTGVDQIASAQPLVITPGKYTLVSGHADYNESGNAEVIDWVFWQDRLVDWYKIANKSGIELNEVTLSSLSAANLDLYIIYQDQTDTGQILNIGYLDGDKDLEMSFDTSVMGTIANPAPLYIGVAVQDGGTTTGADYLLGVLGSVADDSAVVVSGTPGNEIDPNSGVINVLGRGFSNIGGTPTVTFSKPNLQVNSVDFISSGSLNVHVTKLPGYSGGGTTDVEVANPPGSGSYKGRRYNSAVSEQARVNDYDLY